MKTSGGPLDNQTWHTNGCPQLKPPEFGFCTHTASLWTMEQWSSPPFCLPGDALSETINHNATSCFRGVGDLSARSVLWVLLGGARFLMSVVVVWGRRTHALVVCQWTRWNVLFQATTECLLY